MLRHSTLGERMGRGSFSVDGTVVRDAVDLSPIMVRLPSGGPSVRINRRPPISDRYADRGTVRYTGHIDTVHVDPGPQPADTPVLLRP